MKKSELSLQDDFLLTTRECARLMRVSKQKFITLFITSAKIPFVKFDNRILVRQADLRKCIDQNMYIATGR